MTDKHRRHCRTTLTALWSCPMTAVGLLVALLLRAAAPIARLRGVSILCTEYRSRPCFLLGHNWGGLTLGHTILAQINATDQLLDHEWGHTVQNALFGPLMLPLTIASAIRYHVRRLRAKRGAALPPYDAWWFEAQATRLGTHRPDRVADGMRGERDSTPPKEVN